MVVVVGLGMTGLSVVHFLQQQKLNLDIRVIDTREKPPGADQLTEAIQLFSGGWQQEWLNSADLIISSPGIALATPALQQAKKHHVPIIGDIELFAWYVDAPVLAITGSNGKSTVTSLVGAMAQEAGINVGVGGNIGFAALDMLFKHDLYVLELSSFQLETTTSLKPAAAVFLNLSEDHMDRYLGMADYRAAKLSIFSGAERIIVNRDDRETYPDTPYLDAETVSFGFDHQEFGLSSIDDDQWLMIDDQPVMKSCDIALVGRHNIANGLAALALALKVNIPLDAGIRALKSYTGLEHRCQLVSVIDGVKWVNDSKATNVASTLAALDGLDVAGTLHLLVGGDGKGADFSELAPIMAKLPLQLYCFGRDGKQLLSLHANSIRVDTMFEAIDLIKLQVSSGDIVMLSPACASFDQFANFMARGEAFCRYIEN
ncbi:UDP-N-acetylmuramoyl-L-alanine--D-glutamate ligase [Vibrio sp. SS-MA-C1-2]|uniref:UDP-N-acetylmuramoyl-L-alanine--D-glutamate ligase n=1 Tax=Vibrio sp. SS-MA-C1-2 TaxID=2908646 RepID=UPI001F15A43A|nr:UDP-N-acetylmuramoyl-L-alanine--D-glutamate ligase [Vibrio sp. SS-MA-C1-2]UJF20097.1 UDP-N-acetylmuramoyl-L-alanine--D-glutamate ligase [Vibrio sp. SS-MA-C1-2]